MNREEMLAKLKSIEPTAFPTVMTYDMGLEFEVMTSTGAGNYFGHIGDWPLWKFPRLSESQLLKLAKKIEKNELSVNDFEGQLKLFVTELIEYHDDADLVELLKDVVNFPITEDEKDVFVYCDLKSWDLETEFFGTEKEINNNFFDRFSIYKNWEEMDDGLLETYCDLLDENGEGLSFYSPNTDEECDD